MIRCRRHGTIFGAILNDKLCACFFFYPGGKNIEKNRISFFAAGKMRSLRLAIQTEPIYSACKHYENIIFTRMSVLCREIVCEGPRNGTIRKCTGRVTNV